MWVLGVQMTVSWDKTGGVEAPFAVSPVRGLDVVAGVGSGGSNGFLRWMCEELTSLFTCSFR